MFPGGGYPVAYDPSKLNGQLKQKAASDLPSSESPAWHAIYEWSTSASKQAVLPSPHQTLSSSRAKEFHTKV